MLGIGVTISSPLDGTIVEHEPISVRGTNRVRPRPGDKVVLFARRKFVYYPQAPIVWGRNLEKRTCECPRVSLWAYEDGLNRIWTRRSASKRGLQCLASKLWQRRRRNQESFRASKMDRSRHAHSTAWVRSTCFCYRDAPGKMK